MEVRCTGCNKLFRVSDDKITGSGVKFGCTRCGNIVTITKEGFEQYKLSRAAGPALASIEPQSAKTAPAASLQKQASPEPEKSADLPAFDLTEPAAAAVQQEAPPVFVMPQPPVKTGPEPMPVSAAAPAVGAPKNEAIPMAKSDSKPAPAPQLQPKAEIKAPPKPKPEPVRPALSPSPAAPAKEAARPAPVVMDAAPQQSTSSGTGKKIAILLMVLLVIGSAAFGVKFYLGKASQKLSDAAKMVTAPEGLLFLNASVDIDPGTQDLIITGTVQNNTDKPRPAWYVVAEVYDAQNSVLIKAKSLSGKQLYTRRDYEIMAKRGMSIQDIKTRNLQEQGSSIQPNGSVNFEIRIMEPPVGIASFNATLQPFDPVQLFKEMAEEQK